MGRLWFAGLVIAGSLGVGSQHSARGQERSEVIAVTANLLELPSSRAAQAQLQSPVRIYWSETPLRTGLQEIGQQYRLSVWLDRDIDPNQLVTTEAAIPQGDASLKGRFEHIAELVGAEVGLIENVVYIGPVGRVKRLQRAAVELHNQLSQAVVSPGMATLREWSWPELITSKELLQELESNWKITFDESLPYDLFHAGKFLQPTTFATQATVLMGGFEREVAWLQESRFRVVPLKMASEWQAVYRKSDIDIRRVGSLKERFVGAQCQTRGNTSRVIGVTGFHLGLLEAAPAQAPAAALGNNAERYEFEVANTAVTSVLEHLGTSIGFDIEWDERCTQSSRDQRISFSVKQVTLDQLLAEIAKKSSLKIERRGTNVRVSLPSE